MIRLLATDLDGTLLRPDGTVSARTVTALAAARTAGFPVVFVTGRPPRWMAPIVAMSEHGGVAVCANGALLVDLDTGSVLTARHLDTLVINSVGTALHEEVPGTRFAVEFVPDATVGGLAGLARQRSYGHEVGYLPRTDARYGPRVAPLSELVSKAQVVKLLARGPSGYDPDRLLAVGREVVGGRAEVTHSSREPLLEISAPGVSKGSALASYATALGISRSQVAAVGDMPNDVPMLAWAGLSFAVSGSHPEALAAADGRVAPAELDGVAELLEGLLTARSGARGHIFG